MARRRVLVCGATGFIGRNLVETLARRSDLEVHALRFTRPPYDVAGVTWHQGDLRDVEAVNRLVPGMDVIVQAAATTSGSRDIVQTPYIHVTDNAVMNSLLLRACFEHKVGHFVFFSCSVMYQPREAPWREEEWDASQEMHLNYFAIGWTKVYIEKMCEFFSRLGVTRHTAIRHTNVFGPHDKFDLERSHVFGATVTKAMTSTTGSITVWGTGEEGTRDDLTLCRRPCPLRRTVRSTGRRGRTRCCMPVRAMRSRSRTSWRDCRRFGPRAANRARSGRSHDKDFLCARQPSCPRCAGLEAGSLLRRRRASHRTVVEAGLRRMKYRALGRTGLQVSEIGFGAWGIGGRTVGTTSYGDTDDRTSLAALDRALDRGITFFDTSSAYGNGHSESLIGQAFVSRRDEVVIATKAGYDAWDKPPDFSPSAVVTSAEASLRRLRTETIDLFQLHNPPPEALRSPELRGALADLRKAGKIRAWGVSAKSPVEAIDALQEFDAAVVQANFNMMDVRALDGLLAEAERRQAGFIGRTPLCFGFLSGTISKDTAFPPGDHRLGWSRAQLDNWIEGAADLLVAVKAAPGQEAAQSALRFCLAFPAISSVIPGILTSGEADANARASDVGPLPQAAVAAVLEINRQRQFFVARPQSS